MVRNHAQHFRHYIWFIIKNNNDPCVTPKTVENFLCLAVYGRMPTATALHVMSPCIQDVHLLPLMEEKQTISFALPFPVTVCIVYGDGCTPATLNLASMHVDVLV